MNLVRWGGNGLAFNTVPSFFGTDSALYLLQTELVTNSVPVPTGIQFEIATQFAFEGGQSALVKVIRTGDISGTTSISYASADGTATAGSDYTAVSGTLNFAPGELSKIITVPIINDNLFEAGNETFTINLSAPTAGAFLTGPTTTVTIDDSDFRPSVSVASSTLRLRRGRRRTEYLCIQRCRSQILLLKLSPLTLRRRTAPPRQAATMWPIPVPLLFRPAPLPQPQVSSSTVIPLLSPMRPSH